MKDCGYLDHSSFTEGSSHGDCRIVCLSAARVVGRDDRADLCAVQLTRDRLAVCLAADGDRVDDTLAQKRGSKMLGTGMHHDPLLSSRGRKVLNGGHSWVVSSVIFLRRCGRDITSVCQSCSSCT